MNTIFQCLAAMSVQVMRPTTFCLGSIHPCLGAAERFVITGFGYRQNYHLSSYSHMSQTMSHAACLTKFMTFPSP